MPRKREHANPEPGLAEPREPVVKSPGHELLALQRTAGNTAVAALLRLDQQRTPVVQRLRPHGTVEVKGAKDAYLDPADNKVYVKAHGSTAILWKMKEVLAGPPLSLSTTSRDYLPGTASWLAVGAEAPKAAAAAGWSRAQLRAAGLVSKAANHYQLDAADFKGFHVHVSAYLSTSGLADSIHVKFDTRGSDYLSFFYRFDGNRHGGQSRERQAATIAAFTECSIQMARERWGHVKAKSDAVADEVLKKLNG
jgi:hypothetical protein